MKNTIKFDAVKKTWFEVAKNASNQDFSFELDIYKKLLDRFHVGDYYYYIFNCSNATLEFISDSVKDILGVKCPDEMSLDGLLSLIHPDDLPYFIEFENEVKVFFSKIPPEKVLKYKVSYDYRMRKSDGNYIRILQQVVTIQTDEQGAVIRTLGVHTDISHLKKTNGSTLSFIGLNDEPSYYDVHKGYAFSENTLSLLTRKEKEILELLLEGKSSKQIAEELFISKLTVQGHRKSMLKKTNSSSTVELIMRSLQEIGC